MTRIVLHIDRVVVEGTALTPRDAEVLRRGLEAELAVLLRRQGVGWRGGMVAATAGRQRAPAIDGGGSAGVMGAALARSLTKALRPLMSPHSRTRAASSEKYAATASGESL